MQIPSIGSVFEYHGRIMWDGSLRGGPGSGRLHLLRVPVRRGSASHHSLQTSILQDLHQELDHGQQVVPPLPETLDPRWNPPGAPAYPRGALATQGSMLFPRGWMHGSGGTEGVEGSWKTLQLPDQAVPVEGLQASPDRRRWGWGGGGG